MTLRTHIRYDPVSGNVVFFKRNDALAGSPIDDPVIDDPYADISRVKYHSALPYVHVVAKWTGLLTIPARGGFIANQAHTLFAHGLSYTPLLFGSVLGWSQFNDSHHSYTDSGSYDLPLIGSVSLWSSTTYGPGNHDIISQYVALGADATNVYLVEIANATGTLQAALNLEVFVTDRSL